MARKVNDYFRAMWDTKRNELILLEAFTERDRFCRQFRIHVKTHRNYFGPKMWDYDIKNKQRIEPILNVLLKVNDIPKAKKIILNYGLNAIPNDYDISKIDV